MMAWKDLWAKTPANSAGLAYEETLIGHTERVCEAATILSDVLASKITVQFGLDQADLTSWKEAVMVGAWMHDWGKANDHFQQMLRDPNFQQGVRHETLTLIITTELQNWLAPLWERMLSWAKCAALFSATGHHLKFPDPFEDRRTGVAVKVLLAHKDFEQVLKLKADVLGLDEPPALRDKELSLLRRGDLRKQILSLQRELDRDFTDKEKVLIAATKSTVMAADLAGSALPSRVPDPAIWLAARLEHSLSKKELERVVNTKLHGKPPREFQKGVALTKQVTVLVEAGCGSGKTAAAYLWAAEKASGRRLFFCYPTTGTASEGFAGYLRDPDFDAILIHSRSEADYRLLDNMPRPSHEENDLRQSRLEAADTWAIPAVVCTSHTVLGLLENVRRGIYAFPALVQAVFVFDEIHAYSRRLFSYLLRFLKTFRGAPVLLMTATLPPARKQALIECCSERGGLDIVPGPAKRESAKRYLVRKSDEQKAWNEVTRCLDAGCKVLWICNTVGRSMAVVDEAINRSKPVQPYHSRYRYIDRTRRHSEVVHGFEEGKPAMLAVTTQVAEISLDLSADLLVSDRAPVPAMIQRMGRLNRFDEEPSSLGTALFIEPANVRPYDEESMIGSSAWLNVLADGTPKSQSELAQLLVQESIEQNSDIETVAHCEWLDGLWTSLRDQRSIEEAGYSIEVIREEDVEKGKPVEMVIPMPIPRQLNWQDWKRIGRYLVAPRGTILYDVFRGATWRT